MPLHGMERERYLNIKFDGKKNAQATYKLIYEKGLENNIHFQFKKIKTTPNSFASHKLLALAYKFKKQTEVVETLFYDYFIEGIDIGNLDALIRIAKLYKIYDIDTLNYLTSDKDRENLLLEEVHAKELGIKGVPCFIINKKFVLFGAQEKSDFLECFSRVSDAG